MSAMVKSEPSENFDDSGRSKSVQDVNSSNRQVSNTLPSQNSQTILNTPNDIFVIKEEYQATEFDDLEQAISQFEHDYSDTENSDVESTNLADQEQPSTSRRKRSHKDAGHSADDDYEEDRLNKSYNTKNVPTTATSNDRPQLKRTPRLRIWSNGDTKLLFDLYRSYLSEIGPMKKFRMKKDMWAKIASEIPDKSAKQCEERYKTVLKRKKRAAMKHYNALRAKRQKLAVVHELPKIFSSDDSAEPRVHISSILRLTNDDYAQGIPAVTNITPKKNPSTIPETVLENSTKTHEAATNIQDTLWAIAARKEEAKERRHREKMEAIEKMQLMLQTILEGRNNIN